MRDHEGYDTKSSERIRRYVGAAMLKLDDLKKRLAAPSLPDRRALTRAVEDVQAITRELEKGFSELQDASERCGKAQHLAALGDQQAEFVIERSPVAFFVVDRQAGIVRANAAAGRALNLSPSHLVGKSFLLFINGERQRFLSLLEEVVAGRPTNDWNVAVRPRDRGLVPMTVVAAPRAEHVMVLLLPAGRHNGSDVQIPLSSLQLTQSPGPTAV